MFKFVVLVGDPVQALAQYESKGLFVGLEVGLFGLEHCQLGFDFVVLSFERFVLFLDLLVEY